jgi:hypothetical protein
MPVQQAFQPLPRPFYLRFTRNDPMVAGEPGLVAADDIGPAEDYVNFGVPNVLM